GVSYYYRFDEHGRVHSQVGTGGMFPNILYWGMTPVKTHHLVEQYVYSLKQLVSFKVTHLP
ncbi:hypothetical protein QP968_11200, partial [Corynebacterium sp. MSK041]|uniref:hypothetical protein n=1 Tax=Corynebacterium sp. MSK041 TaxID=3050194 RepID=UPI002549E2B5